MPRLFYVHWHKEEALETVRQLRAAGHTVQYHSDTGEEAWKLLKSSPPDALIVSLDRLPSHGRQVAAITTESKRLRTVPVIFVGGEPEKVAKARRQFPAARFCSPAELLSVVNPLELAAARPKAVETTVRKSARRTPGYSGTPLLQKLGIKAGQRLALVNAPADFLRVLGQLPDGVSVESSMRGRSPFDVIVCFTSSCAELVRVFPQLRSHLSPAGSLWIAWPKKASGVATDLSEDGVRAVGLDHGVVDTKVCAVDATWSGLRFVVRLKDRPKS